MSIGDEFREARQRLLDFANTATAEEGWCHSCGDFSADNEAPALTRLRAEVATLTGQRQEALAEAQRLQSIEAERDRITTAIQGLIDGTTMLAWGDSGVIVMTDPDHPIAANRVPLRTWLRGVLDDPRPCQGNANVCAAEGCFGESCVRLPQEETE